MLDFGIQNVGFSFPIQIYAGNCFTELRHSSQNKNRLWENIKLSIALQIWDIVAIENIGSRKILGCLLATFSLEK